jgi:hypothetical protein
VFDDWWYTRFLLPALPMLVVLSVATLVTLVGSIGRRRLRIPLVVASVLVLMTLWIRTARAGRAFDLAEMEQHYYRAGTAVASRVTGTAVIVTLKDSGSVQYHAGRMTLSWDTLAPGTLDEALAFVRARGFTPYLLLEVDEEPVFRDRFHAASALGNLDWPPRVQVGRAIRLYDPADRALFLKDGRVRTEYVRDTPVPSRDWRRWFAINSTTFNAETAETAEKN